MHKLWGRNLAGEVMQSKSYSLRTLGLIRNLSKKEADTFMMVAKFAIKSADKHYSFKGNDEDKLAKELFKTGLQLSLSKTLFEKKTFSIIKSYNPQKNKPQLVNY